MLSVLRPLRRLPPFLRETSGNVALLFGLTAPFLVGIAGLGVDSARFNDQSAKMQTVADSTALAVGKEMHLFLNRLAPLEKAGVARAEAMLVEAGIAHRPHQIKVSFDKERTTSRVEISMVAETFLPVDVWGENPIKVEAEAHLYGTQKLCVLALDGKAKHTAKMEGGARLTAPDCAVQSNSRHPKSLAAKQLSLLVSAYTCTSGGYEGIGGAFLPIPTTDCPALPDPLEMRVAPPVSGCDYVDIEIKSGIRTIQPGHYCGGLKVEKNAKVASLSAK